MTPDSTKGLEVYANTDFCGLFDPETALYDPVTGYIIRYINCLMVWESKLQTKTMMSAREAKYTTCSKALHAAILIMDLIDEANSFSVPITQNKT